MLSRQKRLSGPLPSLSGSGSDRTWAPLPEAIEPSVAHSQTKTSGVMFGEPSTHLCLPEPEVVALIQTDRPVGNDLPSPCPGRAAHIRVVAYQVPLGSEDRKGQALTRGVDPDEDLVTRIGEGDHRAVEALIARKLPRVLSLARRMLSDSAASEDVAQETFMRVWTHAARWQPGQAKFDTWLHRVASNLCLDRLRRRREVSVDQVPEQVDENALPSRGLEALDTQKLVEQALMKLPERQRQAITLCHYQDMTNIEAAEVMGVSVEALESLLSRGRRSLRDSLASHAPNAKADRSGARSPSRLVSDPKEEGLS